MVFCMDYVSTLEYSKEIASGDADLSAYRSQGRTFDAIVVGHGKRRSCPVFILSKHRDVFVFTHHLKAKPFKRSDYFAFRSVYGELCHQPTTSVSATNASTGKSEPKASFPKVFTWK